VLQHVQQFVQVLQQYINNNQAAMHVINLQANDGNYQSRVSSVISALLQTCMDRTQA
jgi:menaquinone-dependent protoporphyrinogen IX oxidase